MNRLISRDMKRFNYLLGEMDAVYHEISLKLGMSDSAMIILYTICDIGDCCLLTEICRLSGLSKQTVNSALRKLEAIIPHCMISYRLYCTEFGRYK